MANETIDEAERHTLLIEAKRWLLLGNESRAKEASERNDPLKTSGA